MIKKLFQLIDHALFGPVVNTNQPFYLMPMV